MDPVYDFPLFAGLTQAELGWLQAHSTERQVAAGDYVYHEGEPATLFYVVLEGELQITRTVEGRPMVLGSTPRGITDGEISLLQGRPAITTSRAIVPSRLMVFPAEAFRQIFAQVPSVGSRLLQVAVERLGTLTTTVTQNEKLAALGKLSAGLAHELNNPAAAARRAATTLREALPALQAHTLRLCSLSLSDAELTRLEDYRREALAHAAPASQLGALERGDREDALCTWLEARGVEAAWEAAGTLVGAGLSVEALEALLRTLPPSAGAGVLAWLSTALLAGGLLDEIGDSTQRISELVSAVKSYTHMDQAPVQDLDLHQGLENSLLMLRHKLKAINVVREYDPALPRIVGRGGQLNQVWTNLLDNAIDALAGQGEIRVITRGENDYAMVEITDNGPGIPEAIRPHIFEPFYTTKGQGAGSGLGLEICYSLIQQHHGTIEVQSQPGLTRFIVRLPVDFRRLDIDEAAAPAEAAP
jgi:signal transduction histidine kinase